jgi:hypothetical protein
VAQRGEKRSDCVHDAVAGVVIGTTRLCMMRAILKTNKIIVARVLHFTNVTSSQHYRTNSEVSANHDSCGRGCERQLARQVGNF